MNSASQRHSERTKGNLRLILGCVILQKTYWIFCFLSQSNYFRIFRARFLSLCLHQCGQLPLFIDSWIFIMYSVQNDKKKPDPYHLIHETTRIMVAEKKRFPMSLKFNLFP